jgi:hypothetical protein
MSERARSCWYKLRIACAGALSTCLSIAFAHGEPARLHHYSVAVDESLVTLRVRACFSGPPPRRLVAASIDAEDALEKAELEGAKRAFTTNGTEMRLGSLPDGACIAYAVDLGRLTTSSSKARAAQRVDGDLITDLGTWFWRPDVLEADEDIDVEFELPAGISVSTPWQITALDGHVVHRVGHGPYDWPAAIAFGHFSERVLELPQARLRIAVLGESKLDEARITNWLHRAAAAVTTLYGRFPVPAVQILVVPGARGQEAVPSAYVLRGGGLSAHFFVNQNRADEELNADWTAVHELSHLLLPYVLSTDAWLSEGAASYFEHVLRARAGSIGAREAWQRIHDGFKRGMQSGARGQSLADATERMYRSGAFLRVYWEGAAIMLLADQRLRSRTGGGQSLDSALDALQRCCLSPDVGWTGREVFSKLDELTGTTVFAELYEEYVHSATLPDVAEADQLLGLQQMADGRVVLLEQAPQRAARDAIMQRAERGSMQPGHAAGAAQVSPDRQ